MFYLKDHLGQVRAILDSNNTLVAAYDYDPWGYPLENRTYEPVNQRYKFTAKERDRESATDGNGYDYFGARYYDSRIGNLNYSSPALRYRAILLPLAVSAFRAAVGASQALGPLQYSNSHGRENIIILPKPFFLYR